MERVRVKGAATVGDLVRYEDIANQPGRVYEVIGTVGDFGQYPLRNVETDERTASDLRQFGWTFEPAEEEDETTYTIRRFYADSSHPDDRKVIATGLTLEEAKEHCRDEATREEGVWFDGYEEE